MPDQPENRPASDGSVQGSDAPVSWQDALAEAYAKARAIHPDFDLLQPVMHRVAKSLHPQWDKILLSEYVEALYCVAKYAHYLEPMRNEILLREAVPAGGREM
jgi:hypothetical protein